MSSHALNPNASRDPRLGTSTRTLRIAAGALCIAAVLWSQPARAVVIYSEAFDGGTVPTNWFAQNGSAGLATLGTADDSAGIGSGNALSITSATRQGAIGEFSEVAFGGVGDRIQLSLDVRLTDFPNNSGGFRFGLYHDNGGLALSSGYRALMGTGTNLNSTDVQADGGDDVNGDIAFGTNRENPPGFQSNLPGINDMEAHTLAMILTRTEMGVSIQIRQDGVFNFPAPVEHITGEGAGVAIPIQTMFNQIAVTTNGGYTGLIDNVRVDLLPPVVPGDVDGDGFVDEIDFNVILGAMFTSVVSREEGDLTGDGFVDFADYRQWKDAPKSGVGAGDVAVPEPSGLAWVGLAIAFGVFVRSRWQARACG